MVHCVPEGGKKLKSSFSQMYFSCGYNWTLGLSWLNAKKVSENMLYLKSYGLSKLGTSAKHIMKLMKKNKEIPFNVF